MDLSRLKLPPDINLPSIPVSYLQLLVEIMAERGVSQEQLLAGVPIERELLAQPEARMSAYQWTLLAMNGIRLSGDPGLGYEYGLRMRPTSHGFLGYATMSCDSMRQAIELCERELAQAGGLQDSVGLRVCAELRLSPKGGYPSVDAVADRMHMSGRSLKRKLQAEGTSYLALLEDVRQRDAQELLRHGGLELQDIAARLGYTNPANFTRAFRKWTVNRHLKLDSRHNDEGDRECPITTTSWRGCCARSRRNWISCPRCPTPIG